MTHSHCFALTEGAEVDTLENDMTHDRFIDFS